MKHNPNNNVHTRIRGKNYHWLKMGLSFFIQSACLVSFLVSVTLVHAQKRVFDVANYGARGDGRTDSSKAFIDAWNGACQNIGGGTVLFPKGTFMVAPVVLLGPCKGSMELRFQGNLLASKKPSDFLGIDHWITVQRVNGLMISGGGTLDGLGADGWGFNDCLKNPGRCKQLPAVSASYTAGSFCIFGGARLLLH
uniref:exopolygalacturonase-like n=1 Tax=Fragaria vesca subsp. vesca TaxID=101020 RepID=UPI0005C852DB|nr:PREDICTED: exopolygalacturonase-like [Fragaria vesca subsp. vesca]